MRRLTIQRSKWLRGAKDGSCLLNDEGRMCCLGFSARYNFKWAKDDILGVATPDGYSKKREIYKDCSLLKESKSGLIVDSEFASSAININDSSLIRGKIREQKLIKLFKENGINLKFVD